MRIGVIGASGFIGKAFCEHALAKGHEVVGYSRSKKTSERSLFSWRVFSDDVDFSNLDALVNFAGESVAQRWTEKKKVAFFTSRVGVTETIVRKISNLPESERPTVLMNASAVGYYGDCGDSRLKETSEKGEGYLADLCLDWEKAASKAEGDGLRVMLGRIGIVLGRGGSAWEQMKTAFRLGGGGNLGSGNQWMPWVDVQDVAGGVLHVITTDSITGPVNLVSPEPLKNRDFTKILASHLKRPAFLPAPEFALRLVFGEFGKHLLDSYRVYPEVLNTTGYQYTSSTLQEFLEVSV